MKDKIKVFLIAAAIVLMIGASYYFYQKLSEKELSENSNTSSEISTESQTSSSEQSAPDFKVYDADGNSVNFSSFVGKPVVINFWASWCGPCQSELPYFQKAYEAYGKDVNFLMVSLTGNGNDSIDSVKYIISENNYTFPVYYDNDNEAAIQYGIRSIPMSCFIDENGNIQNVHIGAMQEETLMSAVNELISKEK
ncbi:MAG TPA: TlpA disulfide reductase family protein [Oscillospiraceae bacterium]|nr:TlpA disulfide reductase family protein [Oscillospiraceae bacterium]